MSNALSCVRVALPVPLAESLTYRVPEALAGLPEPGCRVEVPVGARRVVGVVLECLPESDQPKPRELLACLDTSPAITPELLALLQWVADYYFALIGEVVRLALPPGMLAPDREMLALTPAGRALLAGLPGPMLPELSPAARRTLLKTLALLPESGQVRQSALSARGARISPEQLRLWEQWGLIARKTASDPRGRSHRVAVVEASLPLDVGKEALGRAPRQAELFERLHREGPQDRAVLCAADPALGRALSELIKRGFVKVGQRRVFRSPMARHMLPEALPEGERLLWPDQQQACCVLREERSRETPRPVLLFGEPGSGKTEVYLQLAEETLASGRTVLVLVPEIALTPLLTSRFARRFGERVAILHSALSDGERLDEWQRIRKGEASIVVGARSAVFAPLTNLGLIVVDEEQDGSYKSDERVFYHARDVAVVRARFASALVCLGSATPSLESMHNARTERYRLLRLARPDKRPAPRVQLVDMGAIRTSKRSLLSAELVLAVNERLNRGEQSILFLNRRGWAPTLVCTSCKSALRCEHCSVSMTYHRTLGELVCHACGVSRSYPSHCPYCQRPDLELVGVGTQRLEDELELTFPKARIGRLDRDSLLRKGSMTDLLAAFARGELDILVGTQLVAKGHDFPNVTLVGVLNADLSLNLPDFRAGERTFQILSQVAGRAGRGEQAGEVIIQTLQPKHFVLDCVRRGDIDRFYQREAEIRRGLYPPGLRLALIRMEGGELETLTAQARTLTKALGEILARPGFNSLMLLGPAPAPLARLRERWRLHILIKSPGAGHLHRLLEIAREGGLFAVPRDMRLQVDVDPGNML